ncbi:hypothetical protein LUZ61_018013 [Rhynchospora tenuis]|uniref:Uncharacterized protein n=1 Tax=Rhynchospora tenuis TaxID=198213 RepID=A0AAD6ELJ4_9POAL|nr:hypothetical protein LUZ61_018013 [Rhynchospora tenuis]
MFTVAESDSYDELFGDHPRQVSKLKALVPRLSKNESKGQQSVFAIQVTVFPSHGLVIGSTVHHSACDGVGSVNFMCTWAAICHVNNPTVILAPTPVTVELNRSIVPDPDVLTSFKLKAEKIHFLKEVLLHEAAKRNVTVRCSTTVVVYAYAWVGYVKAKSTMFETDDVYCIFVTDCRQLFQPPIPMSYLGNCIGPSVVQAKLKYIVGPDGFFEACQAIGKTFDEVKKVGIQNVKNCAKISLEIGSKKPFGTSGSVRFKIYDVDFGWGKPAKVDIVSIAYSGAMAIAETREQGGVEIGLCFTKRETEVFTDYIENGLKYMSTLRN